MSESIPEIPTKGGPPAIPGVGTAPDPGLRSETDTMRALTLVGVVVCSMIQVLSVGMLNSYTLLFSVGVLALFVLIRSVFLLILFLLGNLALRFYLSVRLGFFRDGSLAEFGVHLADSLSLVLLMAFGMIYIELGKKRVGGPLDEKTVHQAAQPWHRFNPFRGMLITLPIATTMAVAVYALVQQIQSPVNPYILKPAYVKTYLFVCILFALFIPARVLLDYWKWTTSSPQEADFYVRNQVGNSVHHEMERLSKKGWSQEDYGSACGFMFFVQSVVAILMTCIMVFLTLSQRMGGREFLWPAVASVFVLLTSGFNLIGSGKRTSSLETHIITIVGFLVVVVVGVQSLNFPPWPWGIVYLFWCGLNSLVLLRLSFLWVMDESFARKNEWGRRRNFSWMNLAIVLFEALLGLAVLVIVSSQIWNFILREAG